MLRSEDRDLAVRANGCYHVRVSDASAQRTYICLEIGRVLDKHSEAMPSGKAHAASCLR